MLERLDSWKEIAAYLKRGARTVQRWEREEGLPVHRLQHDKLGSIFAFRSELDGWWAQRGALPPADAPAKAHPAPAVAVLPFADMSREKDQAYFCEGIAEEIISALSRIGKLRVASRTSSFQFRAQGVDCREIGRKLRVGSLLEGSVRKAGERLRISVQLTSVEDGFQLWSARFDSEVRDIFAIQDEIASSVARALEVTLTQVEAEALHKPPTSNLQAYDSYLRGRAFYDQYSPSGAEFALRMFIRAIELDPNYAQAYAGLADCWSYMYLYSDHSEAVRAQAEWASRKAVEMDPASASAQASLGLSLSIVGDAERAETAFETAKRLDPELFEAHYFHARHAFVGGQIERAASFYEGAMRARPDDYQSPLLVAQIYEDLGAPEKAAKARKTGIELAIRRQQLNPDDARALYMAANGLVAMGEMERGRQLAERSLEIRPDDPMLLYNVGCIFAMLGREAQALESLEKAARSGLTQRGWYEHDNNLDSLRSHPRFQAILRELP
jgi:adenylate cyclase